MDIEKILKFTADNLSEYFYILVETLRYPVLRFDPVEASTDSANKSLVTSQGRLISGSRLAPKLFVYVVISILIGVTLNALIPNRIKPPDVRTTIVVILLNWFLYGTVVHLICKLFRGRGSYAETLSVVLQLICTLYVSSSFGALILSLLTRVPYFYSMLSKAGGLLSMDINDPSWFFLLLQFLLLTIYVPLAVRNVHGFAWRKQLSIGFISLFLFLITVSFISMLLSRLIYAGTGIMTSPTPPENPTPSPRSKRVFVGIQMVELTPSMQEKLNKDPDFGVLVDESAGVLITGIYPSSPASTVGLEKGDLILQADGEVIQHTRDMQQIVESKEAGDNVKLIIKRQGQKFMVNIKVASTNRLFNRSPDAQPWIVRIGHRAVERFGARSLKKTV
jgi:hypothetical protein